MGCNISKNLKIHPENEFSISKNHDDYDTILFEDLLERIKKIYKENKKNKNPGILRNGILRLYKEYIKHIEYITIWLRILESKRVSDYLKIILISIDIHHMKYMYKIDYKFFKNDDKLIVNLLRMGIKEPSIYISALNKGAINNVSLFDVPFTLEDIAVLYKSYDLWNFILCSSNIINNRMYKLSKDILEFGEFEEGYIYGNIRSIEDYLRLRRCGAFNDDELWCNLIDVIFYLRKLNPIYEKFIERYLIFVNTNNDIENKLIENQVEKSMFNNNNIKRRASLIEIDVYMKEINYNNKIFTICNALVNTHIIDLFEKTVEELPYFYILNFEDFKICINLNNENAFRFLLKRCLNKNRHNYLINEILDYCHEYSFENYISIIENIKNRENTYT